MHSNITLTYTTRFLTRLWTVPSKRLVIIIILLLVLALPLVLITALAHEHLPQFLTLLLFLLQWQLDIKGDTSSTQSLLVNNNFKCYKHMQHYLCLCVTNSVSEKLFHCRTPKLSIASHRLPYLWKVFHILFPFTSQRLSKNPQTPSKRWQHISHALQQQHITY